jgi:hypothetical protein
MLDAGVRGVFAVRLKARTVPVLTARICHPVVYINWTGIEKEIKELFQTGVQSPLTSGPFGNKKKKKLYKASYLW